MHEEPRLQDLLRVLELHEAAKVTPKRPVLLNPYQKAYVYYLEGRYLKAVEYYNKAVFYDRSLLDTIYGLPNIYFTRSLEELFEKRFRKAVQFIKYSFFIFPECFPMWESLIWMYLLLYPKVIPKVNFSRMKKEFLGCETTEKERLKHLTPLNLKLKKFREDSKNIVEEVLPEIHVTVAEIMDDLANQLTETFRHRNTCPADVNREIKKIFRKLYFKLYYDETQCKYNIIITRDPRMLLIDQKSIKLSGLEHAFFYLLSRRLDKDIDENRGAHAGIMSVDELSEQLETWPGIMHKGSETTYAPYDVHQIKQYTQKKLKDNGIYCNLIENIRGQGYYLNNNPLLLKVIP